MKTSKMMACLFFGLFLYIAGFLNSEFAQRKVLIVQPVFDEITKKHGIKIISTTDHILSAFGSLRTTTAMIDDRDWKSYGPKQE